MCVEETIKTGLRLWHMNEFENFWLVFPYSIFRKRKILDTLLWLTGKDDDASFPSIPLCNVGKDVSSQKGLPPSLEIHVIHDVSQATDHHDHLITRFFFSSSSSNVFSIDFLPDPVSFAWKVIRFCLSFSFTFVCRDNRQQKQDWYFVYQERFCLFNFPVGLSLSQQIAGFSHFLSMFPWNNHPGRMFLSISNFFDFFSVWGRKGSKKRTKSRQLSIKAQVKARLFTFQLDSLAYSIREGKDTRFSTQAHEEVTDKSNMNCLLTLTPT